MFEVLNSVFLGRKLACDKFSVSHIYRSALKTFQLIKTECFSHCYNLRDHIEFLWHNLVFVAFISKGSLFLLGSLKQNNSNSPEEFSQEKPTTLSEKAFINWISSGTRETNDFLHVKFSPNYSVMH